MTAEAGTTQGHPLPRPPWRPVGGFRGRPPGPAQLALAAGLASGAGRAAGRGRVRAVLRLAAARAAGPDERARPAVGAAAPGAGRGDPAGAGVRVRPHPAPGAPGAARRRAGRPGHLPGRGDQLHRAGRPVRHLVPDRGVRAVHQRDREGRAGPGRVLQLARLLRADLVHPRRGRDARRARADAVLADAHRPAHAAAVLPAHAQPADLLAGQVAGRVPAGGGELGGPGLLLPAVPQLRALPDVPGHPGELVHRPAAEPRCAGPAGRAEPGAPVRVRPPRARRARARGRPAPGSGCSCSPC